MNCIFCKIAKDEIPSFKIYEDDFVLSFLSTGPVNHGHVLVIPKKHYSNYEEIDNETLAKIYVVVKKIGLAIKNSFDSAGYNTNVNNDAVAGQIIPHFHVHVIPRYKNDGLELWPEGKYTNTEAETVMNKIKSFMNIRSPFRMFLYHIVEESNI